MSTQRISVTLETVQNLYIGLIHQGIVPVLNSNQFIFTQGNTSHVFTLINDSAIAYSVSNTPVSLIAILS